MVVLWDDVADFSLLLGATRAINGAFCNSGP